MVKKTEPIPTTINIPGGKAMFYTSADLPPRREAEVELLTFQLNARKMKAMIDAARLLGEDGQVADSNPALDGPDAVMTEAEAKVIQLLGLTTTWAYLKDWTLRESRQVGDSTVSEKRPIPATPDDMLDLPRGIFDALMEHGAKLAATKIDAGFTIDGVDDPASPTSA
jgi:hypothetical protein